MVSINPGDGQWRIDRSLVPVLLVLFIQAIGLIVWGAKMDARVSELEERSQTRGLIVDRYLQTERAFLEYQKNSDNRLDRIETKIDRLVESYIGSDGKFGP